MSSGNLKREVSPGPNAYSNQVYKRTKGSVDSKLERARPFRFFLSAVESDPSTHTEELTLVFPGTFVIRVPAEVRLLFAGYLDQILT